MVRCWLVERSYDDRNLVTVVYATPDGERAHVRELSATVVTREPTTAAADVPADKLAPVEDADTRARYREEAERMRERHDPDEAV
jgi:hypothetical protein